MMFFLFIFVTSAAGAAQDLRSSVSAVQLEASPTTMHQDYTSTLNLTCSLTDSSDFSRVWNLSLSVWDNSHIFRDIAVCDNNQNLPAVMVKDDLGSTVTDKCSPEKDEMFIKYSWDYPRNSVMTEYKCEAMGLDQSNEPKIEKESVAIGERAVDFDVILQKMKENEFKQQQEINKLQSILSAAQTKCASDIQHIQSQLSSSQTTCNSDCNSDIQNFQSQITSLSSNFNQQNTITHDLKTRLDKAFSGMFMNSTGSYGGHTYKVTNNFYSDAASADMLCRFHGGYLAEINDKQEFDYVVNFLKSVNLNSDNWIALGATNHGRTGDWSFMDPLHGARTKVSYLNWAPGEPNSDKFRSCLFLDVNTWQMFDGYCDGWMPILCEIE